MGNESNRFLNFARGTGKTVSIRNQALKEFKDGKKVAIISAAPDVYKSYLGDKSQRVGFIKQRAFDKIHLWHFETVLKILSSISTSNTEDCSFHWKTIDAFKDYDFVYVDADCYESIIYDYQNCLDNLGRQIDEWRR